MDLYEFKEGLDSDSHSFIYKNALNQFKYENDVSNAQNYPAHQLIMCLFVIPIECYSDELVADGQVASVDRAAVRTDDGEVRRAFAA